MELSYASKGEIEKIIDLWKNTGVFMKPEDRREVLERLLEFANEAILIIRDDDQICWFCCHSL